MCIYLHICIYMYFLFVNYTSINLEEFLMSIHIFTTLYFYSPTSELLCHLCNILFQLIFVSTLTQYLVFNKKRGRAQNYDNYSRPHVDSQWCFSGSPSYLFLYLITNLAYLRVMCQGTFSRTAS